MMVQLLLAYINHNNIQTENKPFLDNVYFIPHKIKMCK